MTTRHALMAWTPSFCFSVVLIALMYDVGFAQRASSGLNGVVTDSSGGVVPKVTVTLTSESEKYVRTTVTDNAGLFGFLDLTPGLYDISVEVPGFKRAVVNGIRLFVGHVVTQNIQLELGAVAQGVSSRTMLQQITTLSS